MEKLIFYYDTNRIIESDVMLLQKYKVLCYLIRKNNDRKDFLFMKEIRKGIIIILTFVAWTLLISFVDVKLIEQTGTSIGFATFNCWFHQLTGVHMGIYVLTDWLGLVPIFVCMIFGMIGLVQLIKRKSLLKVDLDIILLGVYYILVIGAYLFFEMIPINYRPILIEGRLEASYPSSTTLLVLSVMPTLVFQTNRRMKNAVLKKIINVVTIIFSVLMVLGRLVSGVHWFTDIVGAVLISSGLFSIYKAFVLMFCKKIEE